MKTTVLAFALITCLSINTTTLAQQSDAVEAVVSKMNVAMATHQLDALLSYYSDEMDWENSYGWTIRDKATLKSYYGDWLYAYYPKLERDGFNLNVKVQMISQDIAWVDVLQEIKSEDGSSIARTYRQSHLLVYKNNQWLIAKSRMWLPSPSSGTPPVESVSSFGLF